MHIKPILMIWLRKIYIIKRVLHWLYTLSYLLACVMVTLLIININYLSLLLISEVILILIFFLGLIIASYFNIYILICFSFFILILGGIDLALSLLLLLLA